MTEASRLEALRRRVLSDPTSIAFAALAEEYRRAGRLSECIDTATAGLEHHPDYASARVTLGRALMESGATAEAQRELESALASAPENLAALRALADLYRGTGNLERARELAERGAVLASQDREWQGLLASIGPATRPTQTFGVGPLAGQPPHAGPPDPGPPHAPSHGAGPHHVTSHWDPEWEPAPEGVPILGSPPAGRVPVDQPRAEHLEDDHLPAEALGAGASPVQSSDAGAPEGSPSPAWSGDHASDETAPRGFEPLQRWLDAIVKERLLRGGALPD